MKMDLRQLKSGDKVKLKLVQPDIICSGRKRVTGYFKGVVLANSSDSLLVKFDRPISGIEKSFYNHATGTFYYEILQDLVIYKIIKKAE